MLESLGFFGFSLLVLYVCYWSIVNDDGRDSDPNSGHNPFTRKN